MKVILATGIYPPEIGGPATYVQALAKELTQKGNDVTVITYGKRKFDDSKWAVIHVSKSIPILRWWKYAKALRQHGKDADIVYAFSSVSCGVPIWLARLKGPKKILRLGGDFFWERYTDRGGMMSLKEWYGKGSFVLKSLSPWVLKTFDHIVFSSRYQEEVYENCYKKLPEHSVIENALPSGVPQKHQKHTPFRLLFMGRFVAFKNLLALIEAMAHLEACELTLVGNGPMKGKVQTHASAFSVLNRVKFVDPVHGAEKQKVFAEHDLMVIPSITELTPNVALEARAAGLPVLLTEETGLSEQLRSGMTVAPLKTPIDIAREIGGLMTIYQAISEAASQEAPQRGWQEVAEETDELLKK